MMGVARLTYYSQYVESLPKIVTIDIRYIIRSAVNLDRATEIVERLESETRRNGPERGTITYWIDRARLIETAKRHIETASKSLDMARLDIQKKARWIRDGDRERLYYYYDLIDEMEKKITELMRRIQDLEKT